MKYKILYFFIFFNLSFVFSFKCGHEKIKIKPKILNNSFIEDNKTRRLDSYHPISFFVDYTQMDKFENTTYIDFLKSSINETLKLFSELIKVKRSQKIVIPNPTKCYSLITDYNKNITIGVDYDIILYPIIDPTLDEGVEAAASSCFLNKEDKRPIMGFVLLNQNYSYNKVNAKDYLIMLLLHEITHILVFSNSLYELYQYSGNVTTTKIINGVNKTLIITSTVREVAAQHFGCSSITGIELESQGGYGSIGSHWEARIMLGDYMISTDYPEIVISDISLALFKDSGWYDVNYYSGGLFRFGKGQGCEFLDSLCLTSGKSNFEWEFCDENFQNICTSNNLNRGICLIQNYSSSIPTSYRYFGTSYTGGWKPSDYCPVAISYSSSSYYFSMSCVNGEELGYPSSLGFSISNNSICMKSSLINASDSSLIGYNFKRSMCHEIKCNLTSKKYIVDIGQAYIECPTDGGELEVEGYNGTIICPPFDRVCTSETYIGDPIQAVLKHITSFNNNFDDLNNINDDESIENINPSIISENYYSSSSSSNKNGDYDKNNNEYILNGINKYLYIFLYIFFY